MSLKSGYAVKQDPLAKKARPNPRYSHCEKRIDTGLSRSLSVVSDCSLARLREEVFRRIRPAALVRFVMKCEGLPCPTSCEDSSPVEIAVMSTPEKKKRPSSAPCWSPARSPARSHSASTTPVKDTIPSRYRCRPDSPARTPVKHIQSPEKVAYGYVLSPSGGSQRPQSASSCNGTEIPALDNTLILDIRTTEEFMKNHVRGALSHPISWLCQDKQMPALRHIKGDPSARVIVYGNDDRDGAVATQLLAQKGWENLWLLTGGLKKLFEEPSGRLAVTGAPPAQQNKQSTAATLLKWGMPGMQHGAGSPSAQSVLRREMRCSVWSNGD
eukprot:gnl/MRDRNA2_/MRDRNA2_106467_c0_seq1.p1 gnl/MRDRNA2_/MRDRNA2_106467_c0~~gnl/MRDRNA2_/MRDRNA2_106467_c0_seq1.p1  ORF type:complete len:327 (+),score=49.75 gnl/MRDRNA2_/MRDRNA2_106467_c0_seq1:64-1044(+)